MMVSVPQPHIPWAPSPSTNQLTTTTLQQYKTTIHQPPHHHTPPSKPKQNNNTKQQQIAWDLVYVGYWVMTPFIGGLPPIREGKPGKAPVVIVPGFCGERFRCLSPHEPLPSIKSTPHQPQHNHPHNHTHSGRPRPFTRMRDRVAALGHPVYVFESGWQWGSIVDKSLVRSFFGGCLNVLIQRWGCCSFQHVHTHTNTLTPEHTHSLLH